ncbi:SusC/RagA family TonB-linked outer membrane protein [Bacteroidia bacterium]|nr:SusC/RagA family TonB-linked outer membrane protein [Bacteroidia bacterium]
MKNLEKFLKNGSLAWLVYVVAVCTGGGVQYLRAENPQETKISVTGIVSDADGPIIGASVSESGNPSNGTSTDVNGKYTLQVSSNASLQVSYIGYDDRVIAVNGATTVDVTLVEDAAELDEVVVTGYTSQRKATITGSVSSVSNKEIAVTKNENVLNALTGKLPGVRIVQKSANPGEYDTTIDIRGMGDPLFVIDGITRDKDYFSRMDAEEIESVSVLKDGSAAIYGLRAANGVILVTTKSGTAQNGKVDIGYTGNFTFQQFLYVPEGVSALDYMTLRNEQVFQDFGRNYLVRQNPYFSDETMQPWRDGKPSYDWMDAVFNDVTPQSQHNLSVNGGTENLRYFLSLGYGHQEGTYKSGDLYADKYNVRTNIDATITKNLKTRVSLGAILNERHSPNGTGWNTYKEAWLTRADAPIYANDNPLYPNGNSQQLQDGNNPVIRTNADYVGYNIRKERRINGTLGLTYDVPWVKGLSAKGQYDYTMSTPDNTEYHATYLLYQYDAGNDDYVARTVNSPSTITRRADYSNNTDLQLGLYYNNKFGNHNVNGFVLFEEAYSTWGQWLQAYRELKVNSEFLSVGEAAGQRGEGGAPVEREIQSVIGQVAYDYNGIYMVDARFRNDGSSRFPKGSQWGFFPSVSAGWRFSEESFIKDNTDLFSNLKLRASYGEMGDDGSASDYPPSVTYGLNGNYGWFWDGNLSGGVNPTGLLNPNLTWYKIKMYNAALDFGMWGNLLSGTFEVYRRDRTGLLADDSAVLPGTVGASFPQKNMNADRNFGWEIELQHRNKVQGVNYFVTGQISATKSMRTSWAEEPASNSYDYWRNRTDGRYNNIWWDREAGGMFTSFDQIRNYMGYNVGQNTLPGDWYMEDWNEDGVINDQDNHPIATKGLPVFNYGISTGASWKDFDLAMNFQGTSGVYVSYGEVLTEALPFNGANTLSWFMDRWRPEDPNADYFNPNTKYIAGYYPVTGHDGRRQGTNNVQDASYLRLKTLELGYTVPKNLLSRVGIKSLRVYLSGYNLLTWTGLRDVDPERPGTNGSGASTNDVQIYNYPVNRTYTFGASIKF